MQYFKRTYKLNFPTIGFSIADSLEVSFSVDKDLTPESNKARVEILNLSDKSRAQLETADLPVEIYAGYDGEAVLLYKGTVFSAKTTREEKDEKTALELGDGVKNLRDNVFSLSYPPGTSARTVLSAIASHMGLPLVFGAEVKFSSFPSGFSYAGYGRAALDEVCRAGGLTWSIQNDVLQVIMAGGVLTNRGIAFGTDSGLIGSPERIVKSNYRKDGKTLKRRKRQKEQKEDPVKSRGWKIKTLLAPSVNPGDAVKVNSKLVTGWFRVNKISHKGDYMGSDWTSEMELIEGLHDNADTE